jgi:hypothetical protein
MHLKGFQVLSSHFWTLLCTGLTSAQHVTDRTLPATGLTGQSAGPVHMLSTCLTGGVTGLTSQS